MQNGNTSMIDVTQRRLGCGVRQGSLVVGITRSVVVGFPNLAKGDGHARI